MFSRDLRGLQNVEARRPWPSRLHVNTDLLTLEGLKDRKLSIILNGMLMSRD